MLTDDNGCPNCTSSKGERKIYNWLTLHQYEFKREYRFIDCRDIFPLPFDFYVPAKNLLIEFDGEQHFKPSPLFGGEAKFKDLQRHDSIKNEYCKAHNIHLLRIPYTKINSIDSILQKELAI